MEMQQVFDGLQASVRNFVRQEVPISLEEEFGRLYEARIKPSLDHSATSISSLTPLVSALTNEMTKLRRQVLELTGQQEVNTTATNQRLDKFDKRILHVEKLVWESCRKQDKEMRAVLDRVASLERSRNQDKVWEQRYVNLGRKVSSGMKEIAKEWEEGELFKLWVNIL